MLDSLELNWSVRFKERILSSLQTILQRPFASIDWQMWTSLHMMIDFLKWQIFFKFLDLTWNFSQSTSIGTTKFAPELKTLILITFSNLYPLSNTGFINLGRAQFLCDLITGVPIDICAHIFQTIGKTVAQTCLPFCSLISWYLKVFVHQEMERYWFVIAQYPWCLFRWAKVTLPKYQRVNLSLMPLLPVRAHLLTLCLGHSWAADD